MSLCICVDYLKRSFNKSTKGCKGKIIAPFGNENNVVYNFDVHRQKKRKKNSRKIFSLTSPFIAKIKKKMS